PKAKWRRESNPSGQDRPRRKRKVRLGHCDRVRARRGLKKHSESVHRNGGAQTPRSMSSGDREESAEAYVQYVDGYLAQGGLEGWRSAVADRQREAPAWCGPVLA